MIRIVAGELGGRRLRTPAAFRPVRRPSGCVNRCSISWARFPTVRLCGICARAVGRWGSRRCRVGPGRRCSSTKMRRRVGAAAEPAGSWACGSLESDRGTARRFLASQQRTSSGSICCWPIRRMRRENWHGCSTFGPSMVRRVCAWGPGRHRDRCASKRRAGDWGRQGPLLCTDVRRYGDTVLFVLAAQRGLCVIWGLRRRVRVDRVSASASSRAATLRNFASCENLRDNALYRL